MANNKVGFNYYSADTDRHQDIKIKKLKKSFGCNGFAVYEYTLCEIYRVKGSFLSWDDSMCFDVADYWGLEEYEVNSIVNYCCEVGLFSKDLFTKYSILTSKSIQVRYREWCKLAKRNSVNIPEEYEILHEECGKLHEECTQNSCVLPQQKGTESKGTESKGNRERFSPPLVDEVNSYFISKISESNWTESECEVQAKKFINFYDSKNWFVGNNKMVRWKSAAAGWMLRHDEFQKEKSSSQKEKPSKAEAAIVSHENFIQKFKGQ